MSRQICPLSSRHILCLISVCFVAFFIQSNESLIPTWGTRCVSSQSHHEKSNSCTRPSFFRTHESFAAIGGTSGDSEVFFFADKDTDDEETEPSEQETEPSEQDKDASEENERARLEKIAKQAKLEEEIRLAEEQRESQFQEWREKTAESVENFIVSRNNRTRALAKGFSFARLPIKFCYVLSDNDLSLVILPC